MVDIRGTVKKDTKTKDLIPRLNTGDIALIRHRDIDEVSAKSLVAARVKAVINTEQSSTGEYPNPGPRILLDAGIHILDSAAPELFDLLDDGNMIELRDGEVFKEGKPVGNGITLTNELIEASLQTASRNFPRVLESFVENTLEYAKRELCLVTGTLDMPKIVTEIRGRHAVIVVRGKNYREDLLAIRSYVAEINPVLIGVDGGGDALHEFGYTPDIIIGDMDSVSDETLRCGAELVVHGYMDGRAPGMERIKSLGLEGKVLQAPGMSEDIALLLAYELGAELIVAVGAHSNMIDFLEKGRKGMASTFLVRVKIGSILVDAKGVSVLYKGYPRYAYLTQIALGALFPILGILLLSDSFQQLMRLLALKLQLMLGY